MDQVGDLLIRLKNGYLASKKEVIVPYSKLAVAILELLKRQGFLAKLEVSGRQIVVLLKYDQKRGAMTDVKRISKPGLRVYRPKHNLPRVYSGLGIAIISTPKGVMTDTEARKEGLGGEVMAYVW